MAVYVYGLTHADVAGEIPGLDASDIGAATEPLNTTNIGQWLEDGAAEINRQLAKSGITASAELDETVHASCASAVRAYAVAKSLSVLGVTGEIYQQARDIWEQRITELANRPQGLGGQYTERLTTNIDTQATDIGTNPWSFTGYVDRW